MKKSLKWIGIVILLLVMLPLVVVIAINAFDEKLDPGAAAYGEPRATAVPEAENGYYALLALTAPDGTDGARYAPAWIAEARAAARENRPENHPGRGRAKRPGLCDSAEVSCLSAVRDNAADFKAALETYNEYLERYEKLIAFTRYEEVLDYPLRLNSEIPYYLDVMRAQRAWLGRAAMNAEAGNMEQAVNAIERDVAFYRAMLFGARTLVGKMVAASSYWRDLAFVADLLRTKSGGLDSLAPRLREILKPIDPIALKLDTAIEMEFGIGKRMMKNPAASQGEGRGAGLPEKIGVRLFHKPNASINMSHRFYGSLTEILQKPPATIADSWQKQVHVDLDMKALDYINNPIGKILFKIAMPDYSAYALRLHDLDAYNRLLGLRVEMIGAGVGAEGAADFVAKSEPRFHDPYTQKPMHWDAQKKRIYFEAKGSFAKRRTESVENGRVFIAP